MKLQIGTPVYKITRVRKVARECESIPVAIEYAFIPESIAPKLIKHDVEEGSLLIFLLIHMELFLKKKNRLLK